MCIHVCSVLQMSAKKLTLFCIKRIVTMYNSILKNVLVDVRVLTGDGPPCIHSQCTVHMLRVCQYYGISKTVQF